VLLDRSVGNRLDTLMFGIIVGEHETMNDIGLEYILSRETGKQDPLEFGNG